MTLAILANALVLSFILCCLLSAGLQVLAWSRHSLPGQRVSFGAFWRPEGRFDEVGLRQIGIARRLLITGVMAYLAYGGVIVALTILEGSA